MSYGSRTVLTTATLIVSANEKRRNLSITNSSLYGVVYIGPDSSITTATGLPLYENSTRDQDRVPEGYLGPVYGIVASGTADVRYWETTR